MKRCTPVLVLGWLFTFVSVAWAGSAPDLQTIAAKEAKLEAELKQLRAELKHLRKTKHTSEQLLTHAQKKRPKHRRKPSQNEFTNDIIHYFGGTPIVSSPYLGVRSEFDGHDLIVNISSSNEDLRMLRHQKNLEDAFIKRGEDIPNHPMIDMSGKLEGLSIYQWPYVGAGLPDINLKSAELDAAIHVNRYLIGYMAITYDNSPPRFFSQRSSNSRFFLNKGFITIGHLRTQPWYFTIGQLYLPFGRYGSSMLSSPLPLVIGRVKGRTLLLGYSPARDNHFMASAFLFNGDTSAHAEFQGGVNAAYEFRNGPWSGEAGVSYLTNLADADGMQNTSNSAFPGFGASPTTEMIVHRVPGVGAHFNLSYNQHRFLAEYVGAIRRFNSNDLAFNGMGAQPWAFNVEYTYRFHIKDKPSSLSVGYDHSAEALALGIPRDMIVAAFNVAIWRDTIATLEYRHDINYPVGSSAFGRGGVVPFPTAALGKSQDTLTAQFGIYF